MGRIETYQSRGGPPRRAGTVPAQHPAYGSMTRQRRAMAGFGAGLANLGEKFMSRFLEARVNSEFTEGKALWTQRHNEYLEGLAGEQDYKSIPDNYEKFNEKLQEEILDLASTKRANTGLKNFMIEEYPKQSRNVSLIAAQKEQDYFRASTLNAVNVHIKDGNAPAAIAALIRGRNAGFFSAEEVEKRSQTIAQEVDWNIAIQNLEADLVGFLQDIDDEDYLENLDAELKSQLKRRARTQIGLELAQQRAAREVEINAEQGRLMNLARKGEITNEIIRNSPLDEFGLGSKDTFYKMLDSIADAALKKKEALFKESVPEVEAQILDELRDPLSKITPKDISSLVGKGLSIDDADRFINRIGVFKDPWFGRIDTWLKGQLGWDAAYEKWLLPEGGIAYKVAIDQLFDAIETEKLRGRDIYERGTQIAIPAMVDYWEKVLSLEKPQIERMRRMLEGKKTKGEKKLGPPTEYYESPRFYEDLLKEMQSGNLLDPEGIFK